MPDIIDDAQRHEALFLAQALSRVGGGPAGEQLVIEGVICCEDCEEPIALARLARLPKATRCVECQEEAEQGGL